LINDNWVVITSIYAPKIQLTHFLENGWSIVVVGDSKTPSAKWSVLNHSNLHFLSVELQDKMFPDLSRRIGFGTYARKNIGYIYARRHGAKVIFDTDDDTFLREEGIQSFRQISNLSQGQITGSGFFNPYLLFAKDSLMWPRGYPLSRVASDRVTLNRNLKIIEKTQIGTFEILQTLVNLEPDLDAIFRLTNTEIRFDYEVDSRIFKLDKGVYSPGNTQSTFWLDEAKFQYLYIPKSVSFRFCDILKMYIAQTFCSFAYTGFWSEQIRNPHNYLEDFRSEIECYLSVESLIEVLKNLSYSSLASTYESLMRNGFVSSEDAELSHLFELEMCD
jgi:hypothetical protein